MATIQVICPTCNSEAVVKFGLSNTGKQRFRCPHSACDKKTFILNYTHKGRAPGVKNKIVDMAMNGSGVRESARVLGISINTVIAELKKEVTV